MFRGGFPGGPGGLNLSGIFGADGLNLTEIFGPGFNISNLPGFGSGGRGRGGQGTLRTPSLPTQSVAPEDNGG